MTDTDASDQAPASLEALTVDQLVNTRWTFGTEGRPIASTTFFFTRNGRIEGYFHRNEASWTLEGGTLRILDTRANLTWTFDRVDQPGPVTLHGTYHGPTVRHQKQVLRAFPEKRAVETQGVAAEPREAGEVASDIAAPVHWIELVTNAEQGVQTRGSTRTICVRGAGDLDMMGHYLRSHGELVQEFPFPFQGWGIFSTARAAVARLQTTPEQLGALSAKLPGLPQRRFESALIDGRADVYILSFSQEASALLYRSRSTNAVLPMALDGFNRVDLTKVPYEEVVAKGKPMAATEAQWAFLLSDLEHLGGLDMERFKNDLRMLFRLLDGKQVIVLMLNSTIGSNRGLLNRFAEINQTVLRAVNERNRFGKRPIDMIEINNVLESDADLTEDGGGAHFVRDVYHKLADRVAALLETRIVAP